MMQALAPRMHVYRSRWCDIALFWEGEYLHPDVNLADFFRNIPNNHDNRMLCGTFCLYGEIDPLAAITPS